jgi:hypothetical protein
LQVRSEIQQCKNQRLILGCNMIAGSHIALLWVG